MVLGTWETLHKSLLSCNEIIGMNDKSFTCRLWQLSAPAHSVCALFSGYMGWWPDSLAWLLFRGVDFEMFKEVHHYVFM